MKGHFLYRLHYRNTFIFTLRRHTDTRCSTYVLTSKCEVFLTFRIGRPNNNRHCWRSGSNWLLCGSHVHSCQLNATRVSKAGQRNSSQCAMCSPREGFHGSRMQADNKNTTAQLHLIPVRSNIIIILCCKISYSFRFVSTCKTFVLSDAVCSHFFGGAHN